jgi:hypothetical protein
VFGAVLHAVFDFTTIVIISINNMLQVYHALKSCCCLHNVHAGIAS